MESLPRELYDDLRQLLGALEKDLDLPTIEPVMVPGTLRTTLEENVLAVPRTYVQHWQRFGNLPTALVRDAAYVTKRAKLRAEGRPSAEVEADAHAYAEQVLRTISLQDTD